MVNTSAITTNYQKNANQCRFPGKGEDKIQLRGSDASVGTKYSGLPNTLMVFDVIRNWKESGDQYRGKDFPCDGPPP